MSDRLVKASEEFSAAWAEWRREAESKRPRYEDYTTDEDYDWAFSAWESEYGYPDGEVVSNLERVGVWMPSEICW